MASDIFQIVTCVQCGEREAIVFLRRSGGASEGCDTMLCASCAKGRGIIAGRGGLELNIDDLIGTYLDADQIVDRPATCPSCGLKLSVLLREGRLGCSICADTFFEDIVKTMGRKDGLDPEAEEFSFASSPGEAVHSPDPESSRLEGELQRALLAENYEMAAKIRDSLRHKGGDSAGPATSLSSAGVDFPFYPYPFAQSSGPDDDVVLDCSARIYRDLGALPFPDSPRGPNTPSSSILLDTILSLGNWRAISMAEIGPVGRRSLAERGIVSRGYAAEDAAVVVSSSAFRTYVLFDEGDHLRIRSMVPGLDAKAALAPALALAERLAREVDFARRPGIGWICSRLEDCGLGCSLAATVHIPALAAAGIKDRLFRALLSKGFVIRGFYSSSEGSAGSVYEIGIESAAAPSVKSMADSISAAAATVVVAERRARSEISARGRGSLVDSEGRAFGIARYFTRSGADEAASLVSTLRLASLRGTLSGADHRVLGGLLLALGPGSLALAAGRREMPATISENSCRAWAIRDALARTEYRIEEGA